MTPLSSLPQLQAFAPRMTMQEAAHLITSGLGDAPETPMVWKEIQPADDDYAFANGQRYAVLASVSSNYSLAAIEAKMKSLGFAVTYAWEQGTPTRGLYAIDTWLASLPADATSNHRWVYGEADYAGAATTLGVDAPWPFTIYHLAHVFEAVPAPPGSAPTIPTSTSSSSSSRTGAVVTAGAVILGLAGVAWAVRFL